MPLPLFGFVCWREDLELPPPPPRVERCAAPPLSLRAASLQSSLRSNVVRVGATFRGHHPPPDETPLLLLCSSDVSGVVVKRVPSCIRFVRITNTYSSVRRLFTLLCSLTDETETHYHPSTDDRVGA